MRFYQARLLLKLPPVLSVLRIASLLPVVAMLFVSQTALSQEADTSSALAGHETSLPFEPRPAMKAAEIELLTRYLNNPNSEQLARQLLFKNIEELFKAKSPEDSLKRAIYAFYFSERLAQKNSHLAQEYAGIQKQLRYTMDLAHQAPWLSPIAKHKTDQAVQLFRQAFFDDQSLRHKSLKKLISAYLVNPKDPQITWYLSGNALWNAGESPKDDPQVLYDVLIAAYFAVETSHIAQNLEERWMINPSDDHRFRLVSMLGGFSVLARRWLAQLHGDAASMDVLDNEHRTWLTINQAFHSFTFAAVSWQYPKDSAMYGEGLSEWSNAMFDPANCFNGTHRSCNFDSFFTFNDLNFVLGLVDLWMKQGTPQSLGMANYFLNLFPTYQKPGNCYGECFNLWTLGKDEWQLRQQHFSEYAALFANNDPSDDPQFFGLKSKKWSAALPTCQTCHNRQEYPWTDAEKQQVSLPIEEMRTLGTKWNLVNQTTAFGHPLNIQQSH